MGKLKIIIAIVVVIIIVAVGGFYFYNKEVEAQSLESEFIPMAEDYFEDYVSVNTVSNIYEVTLGDLRDANEEDTDYDLSNFNDCEDDSTVKITIDYGTGKITDTEVELNCK